MKTNIFFLTNLDSDGADVTGCHVTRAFALDIVEEVSVAWFGFVHHILGLAAPASTVVAHYDGVLAFWIVREFETNHIAFCIEVEVFEHGRDTALCFELTVAQLAAFVFTEAWSRVRNTFYAIFEGLGSTAARYCQRSLARSSSANDEFATALGVNRYAGCRNAYVVGRNTGSRYADRVVYTM